MNEENLEKQIPDENKPAEHSPAEGLFEWIELFVYAFALVLVILTFVGRHSPVDGGSMNNTLIDKDILIIRSIGYTPENGDIVVAQSKPLGYDTPIVKRVIATEGQTIDINFITWEVTVDGEVIDEPYVKYVENQVMRSFNDGMTFPCTVPEGYCFVMGDNRNGSLDSRSAEVGFIDNRNVFGKVVFRLFPLSSIGTVD